VYKVKPLSCGTPVANPRILLGSRVPVAAELEGRGWIVDVKLGIDWIFTLCWQERPSIMAHCPVDAIDDRAKAGRNRKRSANGHERQRWIIVTNVIPEVSGLFRPISEEVVEILWRFGEWFQVA